MVYHVLCTVAGFFACMPGLWVFAIHDASGDGLSARDGCYKLRLVQPPRQTRDPHWSRSNAVGGAASARSWLLLPSQSSLAAASSP